MEAEPPSNNLIILLFVAATLVTLSLLFSASESAFLGINKLRVHFLREKGDKKAMRVGRLLERKEELLNMLLVGNELVNVALSVVLTAVALRIFGPAGLGIATMITTILLLIFGEITPKSVTTRYPDSSAFGLSGYVAFFFVILRPFVIIFTAISRLILKIFGIDTKEKKALFTEDEIKTFIDVGGEEGVLGSGEKRMMTRVFKFTDLSATDIMIPRVKITGISPEITYDALMELTIKTGLSRFPVYENDDADNIIGVLYIKDLLAFAGEEKDGFSVREVMRPPLFIPGTTKMSSIQSILREKRQNFAIVIDEYSGTDGILTTGDITKEIFGTSVIEDRNAWKSESQVENSSDMIIDGSSRLIDLGEELHISLESKGNETIAGFILDKLGHIPTLGECVFAGDYCFKVIAMDARRIAKVHCTKITDDEETQNGTSV